MPTYKDINELTQKASMAGTEMLPVSETEYITPDQIVGGVDAKIGNLSNAVYPSKAYFIGQGDSFDWRTTSILAKPGKTYRCIPLVKEWAHDAVSSTANFIGIGYIKDSTSQTVLALSGWSFRDYYDISIPTNAPQDSYIRIGGRANSGKYVYFEIIELSQEVQVFRYGAIPTLGTGNNSFAYFIANGGSKYKIKINNYTKSLLSAALKFQLGYYSDMFDFSSTFTVVTQVNNTPSADVDVSTTEYEISVPERALCRITIRGDEGQLVQYKIENTSLDELVGDIETLLAAL